MFKYWKLIKLYVKEDPFISCLVSAFNDKSLATNIEKLNKRIEGLLQLEKKRRGVSESQLVFIGMANIAKYHWCANESLLTSRNNEIGFFSAYLWDRIIYSFDLGLISHKPSNPEQLLDIGNDIKFNHIEELLKRKAKSIVNIAKSTANTSWLWVSTYDENGKEAIIINPALKEDKSVINKIAIEETVKEAKKRGARIANIEEFPMIRGEFFQIDFAEQYSTIRWNFNWNDYVVVGVPDGITDTFVYEFKTTKTTFLEHFIKPVAFAQADLYGYFFKRKTKRVQILIVEENKKETWEENVDEANAIKTLNSFAKIDNGEKPLPPKEWKCKSCEFYKTKICKIPFDRMTNHKNLI